MISFIFQILGDKEKQKIRLKTVNQKPDGVCGVLYDLVKTLFSGGTLYKMLLIVK